MKQLIVLLLAALHWTSSLPHRGRIIGGQDATPGQFPFMASLNTPGLLCGATILNENWILTAAHCIDLAPSSLQILVGTTEQTQGAIIHPGTLYNVTKRIAHENYTAATIKNDIALIQIDGTLEFGDYIQPADIGDAEDNASCLAMGWGATGSNIDSETLKYVNLTALSLDACIAYFADGDEYTVGPEQVCALGPEGNGACYGDSGGPLVCDGKFAGIVSFALAPCAQGYPDVYTRVTAFQDWIENNIRD